jgi:phage FluMu protein Com
LAQNLEETETMSTKLVAFTVRHNACRKILGTFFSVDDNGYVGVVCTKCKTTVDVSNGAMAEFEDPESYDRIISDGPITYERINLTVQLKDE